jgi:glycogen phosphorylase
VTFAPCLRLLWLDISRLRVRFVCRRAALLTITARSDFHHRLRLEMCLTIIAKTMANHLQPRIAYFSMEIAVDPALPTYAGGLGVLAGDMLRSAADLGVPIVGVTLLARKGYFRQRLDPAGQQTELPDEWRPESALERVDLTVPLLLDNRTITIGAWRFSIKGISGFEVPVYFLDTDLPSNPPYERSLCDQLYGGDDHYRLSQETVLGMGGVLLLRALGLQHIDRFHMNEGHSALLALALLEERIGRPNLHNATDEDVEQVRSMCIFTTHTPVPAGQDRFSRDLAASVLGQDRMAVLDSTRCSSLGRLNMTYLGLRCSRYINGVAMHHGEVSQGMFPEYPIHAITNGVHAVTWTSPPFQELYDRHIPEWRQDNLYLRYAIGIDLGEIQEAHARSKQALIQQVEKTIGIRLSERLAILGFARRATTYKRAELLFSNLQKLREIRERVGRFQVLFGGKAHPRDEEGKAVIRRVFEAAAALKDCIPIVYIENYDLRWAQLLTSGVDLWLNTPHRPYEASGTSGMKAALNGVPSLSIRDGWWMEGHIEGATGWAIGYDEDPEDHEIETASLYDKLERVILPMFYGRPKSYAAVMRSAIALNGSFFNTQRMVSQYVMNAYFPEEEDLRSEEAESVEVRKAANTTS